jgi:hypothetical protein
MREDAVRVALHDELASGKDLDESLVEWLPRELLGR